MAKMMMGTVGAAMREWQESRNIWQGINDARVANVRIGVLVEMKGNEPAPALMKKTG